MPRHYPTDSGCPRSQLLAAQLCDLEGLLAAPNVALMAEDIHNRPLMVRPAVIPIRVRTDLELLAHWVRAELENAVG